MSALIQNHAKPKVSVIIPTYNRASILIEAIVSVLNQTFQPFEIIVVDDGSTDNTAQVIKPYSESVFYIRTENQGVSSARNRGIIEAKGDWVAFLDSDDTWHPEKLNRQVQCLSGSDSKLCFCASTAEFGNRIDDIHLMDPDLHPGESQTYAKKDCRIFKFPRHPFIQAMLIQKSALIQSGPFDESLSVAEDTKLIYQLVLDHDYTLLNDTLVKISRNRSGPGLSDTMDPQSAFQRYSCYSRVQSEAAWRLLRIDKDTARILEKNMRYFQSRQAELACALHQRDFAKRYAMISLSVTNGLADLARNLLILTAYSVAEHIYTRKWSSLPVHPNCKICDSMELFNS